MRLKKVIFDMDGLIFDSERLFMRELGAVMRGYGYNLTYENYVKMLGLAGETLYDTARALYGADYPHSEISGAARKRVSQIALGEGLTIKPGIHRLLAYLKRRGVVCVVASSTQKKYVTEYLKTAGLDGYFDAAVGGDEVKNSKPAPDIFLSALGETAADEALVLEDSENGIKAANAAGIPVICIPDMIRPQKEAADMALCTVESAADVIDVIKSNYVPQVKICGLMSIADADLVNKLDADYAGIVVFFPKSHRNRTMTEAAEILRRLSPRIRSVAVTVSPDTAAIEQIEKCGFDIVQIHGELSETVLENTHIPIFRAFNMKNAETADLKGDSDKIAGYVFDAAEPGSGKVFDWNFVKNIDTRGKLVILAGGLNDENVRDAVRCLHPDVADVSSGVENDLKTGKDPVKAARFTAAARDTSME